MNASILNPEGTLDHLADALILQTDGAEHHVRLCIMIAFPKTMSLSLSSGLTPGIITTPDCLRISGR